MTEILKVLFNRSYWVVPGKLLAGCYPGSEDPMEEERNLKGLIQAGIRHVISLMETQEYDRSDDPFPPYVDHLETISGTMKISVTFDQISIKDFSLLGWQGQDRHSCRLLPGTTWNCRRK